jgi:hypothetical protein
LRHHRVVRPMHVDAHVQASRLGLDAFIALPCAGGRASSRFR